MNTLTLIQQECAKHPIPEIYTHITLFLALLTAIIASYIQCKNIQQEVTNSLQNKINDINDQINNLFESKENYSELTKLLKDGENYHKLHPEKEFIQCIKDVIFKKYKSHRKAEDMTHEALMFYASYIELENKKKTLVTKQTELIYNKWQKELTNAQK